MQDQLTALVARAEIEALSRQFARALDGGTVEMFLGIFTADVDYRSGPRVLQGHDALAAFFSTRAAGGRLSRHLMTGLDLRFVDTDTAEGSSCWLVFAGDGPAPADDAAPYMVADVTDLYRRTADGWRIARRHIVPVFRNVAVPPPIRG